jgi:hypothetical protein
MVRQKEINGRRERGERENGRKCKGFKIKDDKRMRSMLVLMKTSLM